MTVTSWTTKRSPHRLTTPTSLDRTVGDDDSGELVDLLPDSNPGPEQEVMEQAKDDMVTGLLDILDERARYAVEQRFGLHDGRKRSYREVGEELGVTAEGGPPAREACGQRGP